jgi:hypothetical protein
MWQKNWELVHWHVMSNEVIQIIPCNKFSRSSLRYSRNCLPLMELGSPLSCAQYLAIYSCRKTVESILCLLNVYCIKICCNAFLPFMPSLQSGFLTSGFQLYVWISHLSMHSSFPSHLILLYFYFVFILLLQLLTYCLYWQICPDVLALEFKILAYLFRYLCSYVTDSDKLVQR